MEDIVLKTRYEVMVRETQRVREDNDAMRLELVERRREVLELRALLGMAPDDSKPQRVLLPVARHKVRGGHYCIRGDAGVQAAEPIVEGDTVVVYIGIEDGKMWVRPKAEFEDGRFEV